MIEPLTRSEALKEAQEMVEELISDIDMIDLTEEEKAQAISNFIQVMDKSVEILSLMLTGTTKPQIN